MANILNNQFTQQEYRPDIDGLRAIAVLSVVTYHAFPNLVPGGFLGVDIFFVISGYLISKIILNNLENNNFSFFDFYARRVRRIFPALFVVLLSVLFAGWFFLLPSEYKQLGKHVLAGAGFVANLMYWREVGYFDVAAETKPLLHLWSLGVEEQFYIFWPVFLYFLWKRKINLLKVSLILFFISCAAYLYFSGVHGIFAFYAPVTRFWELLAGGLLAFIKHYKGEWSAVLKINPPPPE